MKPSQAKAVLASIVEGDLLDIAASKAGVSRRTLRRWRTRGGIALGLAGDDLRAVPKSERAFARFATSIDRELAKVEATLLRRVSEDPDWRSAAWTLERRWPQRYAASLRVSMSAGVKREAAAQLLELLKARLPPKAYEAVLEALSDEETLTAVRPRLMLAERNE